MGYKSALPPQLCQNDIFGSNSLTTRISPSLFRALLHGSVAACYQLFFPRDRICLMPHKFNASRRHKFAKKQYRVRNWDEYNESLRNRGDLTVWISPDVQSKWAAPQRGSRGGQPRYSDLAITVCLTLGMVYKLPLRQTQGLVRSISQLMGLGVSVPDSSTLSRRGRGLSLPARPLQILSWAEIVLRTPKPFSTGQLSISIAQGRGVFLWCHRRKWRFD